MSCHDLTAPTNGVKVARPGCRVALACAAMLLIVRPEVGSGQLTGIVGVTGLASDLPLRPEREVHFRVTEGTWMSLDVSPDGQTIVFDLLGDLYTLPIVGGAATRLTSGMAFNRQPRFSPDGSHVVFVSDRGGSSNVWIADRNGGSLRQLSNLQGYSFGAVTSPAWAPDGRSVVVSQMLGATRTGFLGFSRAFRWLLAAYDVKTGAMRWISDTTPGGARSALGPVFSPDGRRVYAAVDEFHKDWWSEVENWRVAEIDSATGRIQPEMGSRVGRTGMRPALSRDGRYLVYASSSGSHTGFRLRDLRTGRERWLLREVLDDPPLASHVDSNDLIPGYAFTPDSRSIIAAYGGQIRRIDVSTGRAVAIPFFAEVERKLGPLHVRQFTLPDTAVRTRSVLQPALSPDGKRVAFSALDRIWVMHLPHDAQGVGRPFRATADSTGGEFYPSWSADGGSIIYSSWVDGVGGMIRQVRLGRDELAVPRRSERLTSDTAIYFNTAVSPDGSEIVALRANLPRDRVLAWTSLVDAALVGIPLNGGRPWRITALKTDQFVPGHPRYPTDQLYFTADTDRIYVGLTSWLLDGTHRHSALTVTGPEDSYEPADVVGVFAPDRRRALVTRKYELFEVGVPTSQSDLPDTLNLQVARSKPFGAATGTAQQWGRVLAPWISWSRDGRRVLFSQGGSLFVGQVQPNERTKFSRIDVPLDVPVDVPRGTVVLRGARLLTMGRHEVIEKGDIVVRDNRIVAIGATGEVVTPTGATILDMSGSTILPGYIDLHDHMLLPKGVHANQCWQCLTSLAYGVTAARDPQPSFANDVFTYRERERRGDLIAPRIFSTGMAYFGADPPIRTLSDAREVVRPNAEYFGSETFKVHYDPSAGRRTSQLLEMAATEQGLNATVHALATEQQVTVTIDGFTGLEHPLAVRMYADVAMLAARSGTTYTETYASMIPGGLQYIFRHHGGLWQNAKMRRFAPPSARASTCSLCSVETWNGPPELDDILSIVSSAARIVAMGGRVAVGSHGDIPGLGLHYEMWLYALGGMTNYEVLRSATIIGADAIGHSKDLGSLEPGKLADLQVLDRNPLEDIHNSTSIRYVMKNGRLYQAEELTESWPRHQPLPSSYIWEPPAKRDTASVAQQAHPAHPRGR
jgi:Tol biopolymer transport system component